MLAAAKSIKYICVLYPSLLLEAFEFSEKPVAWYLFSRYIIHIIYILCAKTTTRKAICEKCIKKLFLFALSKKYMHKKFANSQHREFACHTTSDEGTNYSDTLFVCQCAVSSTI